MSRRMQLISVIISAYNCEALVVASVQSILNQTYENIEILIADDGSTDCTRAAIDRIQDHRIKTFHNEKNLGLLTTWNLLAAQAQGDFLAWQDADDSSHPERLARTLEFLKRNPDVAMCGCNFIRTFPFWRRQITSNYPTTHENIWSVINSNRFVPFCGATKLIRREIYEETGGFRPFFSGLGWEDFDLILRIGERHRLANLPDILYEYRYFPSSASRTSSQYRIEKLFINEIGLFLAGQRQSQGIDALMPGGDKVALEEFIVSLTERTKNDPSMPYWRQYCNRKNNLDYLNATQAAWLAVQCDPLRLRNYQSFLHLALSFVKNMSALPLNRLKKQLQGWPHAF